MNTIQVVEQEKTVLRWGGLSGISGGLLFIVVFVFVAVFVGIETIGPEEMVSRFPDIQGARTVENGLYLLVLVLWVPHYLALYQALKRSNLSGALFGSVISIMGLTVLAAGGLPHVATLPISNAYHAAGATAADQALLVAMWQAAWAMFDALLYTGLAILPLGTLILGRAMFNHFAFGKAFGWLSIVLGAAGVLAAIAVLVNPQSSLAAIGIFSLIIFHIVLGWRVFRAGKAAI